MAKASITSELEAAVMTVTGLAPFSTHPHHRRWLAVRDTLTDIEAVLQTIEAFRPGLLLTLESAALIELQVVHEKPLPVVDALIARHCRRKEPLR